MNMRSLGIDLTGSEKRASGVALLEDYSLVATKRIKTNDAIIEQADVWDPDIISIDSPLSYPEDPNKIYRECELTLKRRGIGVYWCLLPSMKALTMRGIHLANYLRQLRDDTQVVIESYPGAAQDILGIPRKSKGLIMLRDRMEKFGIQGIPAGLSHDELDAITAALVGIFYLRGEYEALGPLILPRKKL
jgi:predicted nuclease with RNAse H fold